MFTLRADTNEGSGMAADHARDGESRVPEVHIILSVGCALSTIAVGLRSYTRLVLLRTFGFDDAVMLAAQVLAISAAIAIGLESIYGLGSHTWVQPKEHFVLYMKSFYSSIVVYNVSMCLVKISILLQYQRIFAVRIMQVVTFCGILFMTAWAITLCFLLTLVCIPVAKFWDASIPGRCLDSLTIWYVMAAFNVATDFATFAMPLPVIGSLQLPRRQKIMLSAVFGLGLFTCIISIIRVRTLKVAASTDDPNWDNVDAAIWSFVELSIAIIAACLPTLRPIFSKVAPRVFGSSAGRGQSRPQYGAYVHAPESAVSTNPSNSKSRTITGAKSESACSLRGEGSIELTAKMMPQARGYSISVTGGKGQGCKSKEEWRNRFTAEDEEAVRKGGIQTTTIITQQVRLETAKQG